MSTMASWWGAAVQHGESAWCCDDLVGWDIEGVGGREAQEGGRIYLYIQVIPFVVQQKHNAVKQLYSNNSFFLEKIILLYKRNRTGAK